MARELEAEVEKFFDIESDLRELAEEGVATPAVANAGSGDVVAAEYRSLSTVPNDYPIQFTGETALALELELNDETKTTVFLDWPEDGTASDQAEALSEATGVSFSSFTELYGETVPIEVDNNYAVVAPVRTAFSSATGDTDTPREDEERDEKSDPSPQVRFLFVLSGPWLWAAYEYLLGNGLTLPQWGGWILVGLTLWFVAVDDRNWVAKMSDWKPSTTWPIAIAFCPPVVLTLYSVVRFLAIRDE